MANCGRRCRRFLPHIHSLGQVLPTTFRVRRKNDLSISWSVQVADNSIILPWNPLLVDDNLKLQQLSWRNLLEASRKTPLDMGVCKIVYWSGLLLLRVLTSQPTILYTAGLQSPCFYILWLHENQPILRFISDMREISPLRRFVEARLLFSRVRLFIVSRFVNPSEERHLETLL